MLSIPEIKIQFVPAYNIENEAVTALKRLRLQLRAGDDELFHVSDPAVGSS